ncbi:peptidoglycan editing factor PgeF [Paraliomyxa miuraensis]|uniref:peptidoglycan editing factor PgeF n=1 Tax=Paraliomyxa miuraensis TaxID=376150 RepID=UPI00225673D9|nr:peptidoglycan editing factor PgeF [Paraliomyxa miuraensis]MCX4240313.1 peptidoglycan editing factor PgeF [Paraliomyxa miuraensis]
MLECAAALSALAPSVVHGFTDRRGGHSQGRYASLNFGRKWGDDPEAVRRNLEAVAGESRFDPAWLVCVRQVHGADVLRARDVGQGSEADALWCHREDGPCVVGVLTADCVPVLIADRQGEAVAAIHSGWRGTVAGVVARAVRVLAEAGVPPERLVAAIGPCIEQDAFEVGEEVAAQFDEAFVERERWPKPHVDLVGVVRAQLRGQGVPEESIERVGACTHAHPERYFSFRRDGGGIGQMMSFIGVAG